MGLSDPRTVYVIQGIAGAVTCILIVLLGRRLLGRDSRAPILAGWMAAFYPFFILSNLTARRRPCCRAHHQLGL